MKGICRGAAAVLALVVAISGFVLPTVPVRETDHAGGPARSYAVGDPVAVIAPLPEYVSNGSEYDLNASDSYDTDGGFIKDFLWEIVFGIRVETSHASPHRYLFRDIGLYKITLTVTDNNNQTGKAFTAVVCVLDTDNDHLPDWWELQYFSNLNQTDDGDPDGDGYTNLEEYARGTNPAVADARPERPDFLSTMADNWYIFVVVAAIIVCIGLSFWPLMRRRRQIQEKKKIDAAIEIEKELETEDRR